MEKTKVSRAVTARAEAEGWLVRSPSPDDRRVGNPDAD